MKKKPTSKDVRLKETLYLSLDKLINYANSANKTLSNLTLTLPQFDNFKVFNKPDAHKHYFYRGIKIKTL